MQQVPVSRELGHKCKSKVTFFLKEFDHGFQNDPNYISFIFLILKFFEHFLVLVVLFLHYYEGILN